MPQKNREKDDRINKISVKSAEKKASTSFTCKKFSHEFKNGNI